MTIVRFFGGAALVAAVASPVPAHAEDRPDIDPGARLRGGVSLLGGAFASPDREDDYFQALFQAEGRVGLQVNDIYSFYFAPTVGAGFGEEAALYIGATAFVADFMIDDQVFLAAGPDAFVVIGLDDRGQDTGFAPGVRARVGLLPAWTRDEEDGRRRGFAMAVDVRVHFFGEVVMMSPALMLGYETY